MKIFANYLLRKEWILRIVMYFLSEEKQERIIIAKIREEFILFGKDISDMSDDEIKEGIIKVGNVMSKLGFTVDEVGQTLHVMAQF